MTTTAKLVYEGKEYEFPVIEGSEGEKGIVISDLRSKTGLITLDPGYGNTGSCRSAITFIDGEKGILRYRGYPIEQVAERARFTEVCYLLIYGQRPDGRGAQGVPGQDEPAHAAPRGHEEVLRGVSAGRAPHGDHGGDVRVAVELLPGDGRRRST